MHAAAPHVPPDQLLELLSNVNYGEVKYLVQGILGDYRNDIDILDATLKVLDADLHCCEWNLKSSFDHPFLVSVGTKNVK